jgi:hypothetical protein
LGNPSRQGRDRSIEIGLVAFQPAIAQKPAGNPFWIISGAKDQSSPCSTAVGIAHDDHVILDPVEPDLAMSGIAVTWIGSRDNNALNVSHSISPS